MKIRIISEKKIKPQPIVFPTKNAAISNIHYPHTHSDIKHEEHKQLSVFVHEKVYQAIWQHSCLDMENELGGALIGIYGIDEADGRKFILITDVINQPPEYFASPTLIRFTTPFYDHIAHFFEQALVAKPHLIRLGLYHTHPDYGVFLSRTDVQTFKGIFKENYQIAMVVDPVKRHDGIFYWQADGEISERTCFRVYSSTEPNFSPYLGHTTDEQIADYNPYLIANEEEDLPIVTKVTPKNKEEGTGKNLSIKINPPSAEEKVKLNIKPKTDAPQEGMIERIKLKINTQIIPKKTVAGAIERLSTKGDRITHPQGFMPKMCPLYDFRYEHTNIKLKKYFRSLKEKTIQEYPYMIFTHLKIKEHTEAALQQHGEVLGIIQGEICYDALKKDYYVELREVLLQPIKTDTLPFNYLEKLYLECQYEGKSNLLGWIYATNNLQQPIYHFFEKHQELFSQNYHLGLIVKAPSPSHQLDLGNMNLVAYNFEEQAPYEYFKHFFLYEKTYS